MSGYRPIGDVWILGRAKLHGGKKYYGSYPAGFLSRARVLIGAGRFDPVLHVCGGMIRDHKCGPSCRPGHYHGFGINDQTLDIDPACQPDYLRDAREALPLLLDSATQFGVGTDIYYWKAILIDRPYGEEEADNYAMGRGVLPEINALLKNSLAVLPIGGKVGVLDYVWPMPPKNAKEVAVVGVGTGRNNRARWFTVFERLS